MRVPRARFEVLAEEALQGIPPAFQKLILNVEIAVKALPGPEAGRWRGSRTLLGLYTGLDRAQMQSPLSSFHEPARILLYQRNIEAYCEDEEELARRVRTTLRHELAHHFGFTDRELRERWPEGA
ncbi:MAG: metallopeptidase family protein [Elusimicrobia bacterium]|nr:metallopeptidase family protein [Elusimicrobiota bacterium]